ncbi:hypothetical protein KY290_034320 [Solanum tuberosum]|uniref:Uncharacterized protein n=1 Tax=Solanum tuberosum TaxID=4113 RepID=A0ABQ7U2W6_SOLTU|nr:hypothetical protein KY284_033421 [Solanum tuberosum]KAH0741277.1 hypothetical protein KY290_034320 [Solanum tuberosum]
MMTETGQNPGRGQLYLATHRNEDESYFNEAAKEIYMCKFCTEKKNELAMTQSTIKSLKFRQMMSLVRYLEKNILDGQDNYNVMMNSHTQLMNASKAYMIMKEGAISEQFAEIFISTTPSMLVDPFICGCKKIIWCHKD